MFILSHPVGLVTAKNTRQQINASYLCFVLPNAACAQEQQQCVRRAKFLTRLRIKHGT